MPLCVPCRLFAPRSGSLYCGITQRIVKNRKLCFAKIENLRSKPPRARSALDKRKLRRAAETFPHLGKLSRQKTSKDGMHIDAGVIIGKGFGFCFVVITVHRMVQAFAHVIRERDGAKAANAVGK